MISTKKNTTATLSTLPPLHFRNLNRDSTSMTFSLMGRPAGHFLSTLMKAEILHPAAFLVKHFSEKKMPKLLPNFTQGRLAHISNTEKKYQSHEFVSYLSHSEEWCHFSKLGCFVSPYIFRFAFCYCLWITIHHSFGYHGSLG